MSGITFINRLTGSTNNLVYIETSDTTATATGTGYITAQAENIADINEGGWTWEANDCIMLSASDGISWCSINSTFTTLTSFSGFGAGDVTLSGASVIGNFPVFSSVSGQVIDSGHLASNIMYKNVSNQMAAGATVLMDKAPGTVSTGSVTINKQSGVITAAVTTAAAATTAITLNNSEITSTSVLLVSNMGGSNTTIPGVQLSLVYVSAGVATLNITNNNVAGTALNGNVLVGFAVL
jgi:hypothetical protein